MEEWKDIGDGYFLSSKGRMFSKTAGRNLRPGKQNGRYVYYIGKNPRTKIIKTLMEKHFPNVKLTLNEKWRKRIYQRDASNKIAKGEHWLVLLDHPRYQISEHGYLWDTQEAKLIKPTLNSAGNPKYYIKNGERNTTVSVRVLMEEYWQIQDTSVFDTEWTKRVRAEIEGRREKKQIVTTKNNYDPFLSVTFTPGCKGVLDAQFAPVI